MIIDLRKNSIHYKGMNKNLDTAINFIANTRLDHLPAGKTVIDGENVFVNVGTAFTTQIEDCNFETHSKYLDIHMVIIGFERFAVCQQELTLLQPYDDEKDLALFSGEITAEAILNDKNFIICLTEEAHLPGLSSTLENQSVKKAVFKVKK